MTLLNAFTFHFQVEKLVKALKDYYNSQGTSNTDTLSTGGGDTSQVKYFSIYNSTTTSTDTVTFYINTFNSGTSAESERLQTFFLFLQRGSGGHFPFSSNLLVNLIETPDQVQYTPLLRPLLFGFYY